MISLTIGEEFSLTFTPFFVVISTLFGLLAWLIYRAYLHIRYGV